MGRPKALIRYRGDTFLDRLIGLYRAAGVSPVVVLGRGAELIRSGVGRGDAAVWVINPDPARGQTSSLQEGLRALPADCAGFFIHPVDTPAVELETISQIRVAFESPSRPLLVVPRFDGRRGHPVLARGGLSQEFLALGASGTARDVIHAHIAETQYVDVADPGILKDIDTPEDYDRLIREEQA